MLSYLSLFLGIAASKLFIYLCKRFSAFVKYFNDERFLALNIKYNLT